MGAKLELNQHINVLESKIGEGNKKLDELSKTTDDSWETLKEGIDEAWESISIAFKDAYKKFL